jgi:alpha-ketoglutarate-dependent taurine dioxygenase
VHAIELYLNAYLRHAGHPAEQIRSCRHDLAERVPQVAAFGLTFRKKTVRHLVRMTAAREYLIVRYGPEQACKVSETNRLTATLEEVAGKVLAKLAPTVQPEPAPAVTTTSAPGASASS